MNGNILKANEGHAIVSPIASRKDRNAAAVAMRADGQELGMGLEFAVQNVEPHDLAIRAVEAENERLVLALEQARDELEKLQGEQALAIDRAFESGREAGRAEIEKDESQALQLLESGCRSALDQWKDRLGSLDLLALALTKATVHKILGNGSDGAGMVGAILAEQLHAIEDQTSITVMVSAEDFTDESSVNELGQRLDDPRLAIVRDGRLESGDCRIRLRLGEVDIGLPTQLAAFDRAIGQMAEQAAE